MTFSVDPFVKTHLRNAAGKLVADFHPPGMRTESQLAESIINCRRVEELERAALEVSNKKPSPDFWWLSGDEQGDENVEEVLIQADFDKGRRVVAVQCSKKLPDEFYIWDNDYERDEPHLISGPFTTEAEARAALNPKPTAP